MLNDALSLEEAAPRLYALNWFNESALDAVWRATIRWPPQEEQARAHLGATRQAVTAIFVGSMQRHVDTERLTQETNVQIDHGEIASEARQIIPAEWRERVTPLRSFRLNCTQYTPYAFASPRSAPVSPFGVLCNSRDLFWLRGDDGQQIAQGYFGAQKLIFPKSSSTEGQLPCLHGAAPRHRVSRRS